MRHPAGWNANPIVLNRLSDALAARAGVGLKVKAQVSLDTVTLQGIRLLWISGYKPLQLLDPSHLRGTLNTQHIQVLPCNTQQKQVEQKKGISLIYDIGSVETQGIPGHTASMSLTQKNNHVKPEPTRKQTSQNKKTRQEM